MGLCNQMLWIMSRIGDLREVWHDESVGIEQSQGDTVLSVTVMLVVIHNTCIIW